VTPNPHAVIRIPGSNGVNTAVGTNQTIRGLKKMDFYATDAWHFEAVTTMYADIVLPRATMFEEDPKIYNPANPTLFIQGRMDGLDLPGEVRPTFWMQAELAKRLGVLDQFAPEYTTWDAYPALIESKLKAAWETTAKNAGLTTSYDEIKVNKVVRVPKETWKDAAYSAKPTTKSGKIEFYSSDIADPAFLTSRHGYGIDPPYQIPALPMWQPPWDSFWDSKVTKYPLNFITPHARFRAHSAFDNNSMLRDELYRHAVWLNPADAKARGIKDNDLVHVYNDNGEMIMPAYVTSRITPGVTCIYHGAWAVPSSVKTALSPDGIDTRGHENLLTYCHDQRSDAIPVTGLVEVEKF
jgi:anaerobic dimethyl sulfoxide reductase subunit A